MKAPTTVEGMKASLQETVNASKLIAVLAGCLAAANAVIFGLSVGEIEKYDFSDKHFLISVVTPIGAIGGGAAAVASFSRARTVQGLLNNI